MTAQLYQIYIAQKGQAPMAQPDVVAQANKGLVGDRYFNGTGTFSEALSENRKSEATFIAKEEIDRFSTEQDESLDYGDVRRNLVTQGISLDTLIGKQFRIGSVVFMGIEHCEPCAHLAATVNRKVLPHLVHTGLRASIVESGTVHVGDQIEVLNG